MSQYATYLDVRQLGVRREVLARFVSLSAVVATGTTPPALTLSGNPLELVQLVVQCTSIAGGAGIGLWTGRYSIDNGVTWTAFTSTSLVKVFDQLGTDTGIVLNIAAGNAAVNNQWTSATSTGELDALAIAQSSIADGYIAASGKVLPLASWGADLRQAVAKLVAYEMMAIIGFNPETPGNMLWADRYNQAMNWLKDVEAGRASNINMIEATPVDTKLDRIEIVSEAQRGW